MFTFLDAEKVRIQTFINKQNSSGDELEARIFPQITGQNECIDFYQFNRILSKYIFSKENGGFELKKELISQLNVTSEKNPNIRESVRNTDSIKLYWLEENIDDIKKKFPKDVFHMTKKRNDFVNLSNYPVRISLSSENILKDDDFKLLNDTEFPKEYRLQNRISVYTEDGLFRIDFTSVKFGRGKTFKESDVLNSFPCHEIEIECIKTDNVDKEEMFTNFMKHIGQLLSIYYDTNNLLTISVKELVVKNYLSLVSKKGKNNKTYQNYITAKPVTLHVDNIRNKKGVPNILSNNAVTYKADGVNMLLYVCPNDPKITNETGNVFLLDSNFSIISTGITIKNWDNTIVEGEYINNGKMFYAYDMLYAKKLDIRNKPLINVNKEQTSRLGYLQEFINDIKKTEKFDTSNISVIEKTYLFGNGKEIFDRAKKLWDNKKQVPFHVDGLIFISSIEPYPNKPGSWYQLFKWKPPRLNSFDFLIEITKDENKKDKLYPYVNTEDVSNTITQYKKLKLYSTGSSDDFNKKTNKINRKPFPKLFREVDIPVNAKGQIIATDPLTNMKIEIVDNTIVEFSYDKTNVFKWTPIRVRNEKTKRFRTYNDTFGNSYKVVLDIWESIINPVTETMITTGEIPESIEEKTNLNTEENKPYTSNIPVERLPYQNFHTVYVKKKLLSKVSVLKKSDERGSLIDFGVSRGGDLNRWDEIGYKKVVGIDVDIYSIEEAISRYQKKSFKTKVTFLCGDLSKLIFPNQESACDSTERLNITINWKEEMKKSIPQKYMFDVVSSQFVIHYFFKKELSLRTFLQNVTDNLSIGGYFVGSTFDGSKIFNSLKRKMVIEGKKEDETIWKINKLYNTKKFTEGRPNWGMEIDVFVKSIGIPHKEYLVSFEYLTKICLEYGLELQEIIPFSNLWNEGKDDNNNSNKIINDIRSMSDSEKTFSFMFSGFIFKKIKNAPDSLYKKILTLQKKELKK